MSATAYFNPRRSFRRLGLAFACVTSLASTGCDLTPEQIKVLMDSLVINDKLLPKGQQPAFQMVDPATVPSPIIPGIKDAGLPPQLTPSVGEGTGGQDDGSPSQIIVEADLVQVEGDKLYALSEHHGLTVIDVQDPDKMRVLGNYRTQASAFEMYVDNGQVTVMLRNVIVDDLSLFEDIFAPIPQSSEVLVLDAQDPTQIRKVADWKVPGTIVDSRQVANRMYVMSHEHARCWNCKSGSNVTVSSFDVSDPSAPSQLANLVLPVADHFSRRPSMMATSEHLYVASSSSVDPGARSSTIRAIDISNPNGSMKLGATIDVQGAVTNRWQMNEYQNVLRVITQPEWSLDEPTVETYSVQDIQNPQLLGSTTLKLPRPEELKAVRFDKDRGYAITFERTDPLFTIDLSDPKNPAQRGELEIPGWVYHMEPRGERLLGIGFDPQSEAGSLHASLFDVSDLQDPQMIERVNFGGKWGRFPEGQNQIHKAFKIFDDQQLMAIPFRGQEPNPAQGPNKCERHNDLNGVMLVDWKDDRLTLRGRADTRGQARRSLLHRDRLLAVSNESVRSYDISNRDKPQLKSQAGIALNVSHIYPLGNDAGWLRLHRRGRLEYDLDIVNRDQEGVAFSSDALAISQPAGMTCRGALNLQDVFIHENRAFVFMQAHDYEREKLSLFILTLDVSGKQPRLVNTNEFDFDGPRFRNFDSSIDGISIGGEQFLQRGSRLFWTRVSERSIRPRQIRSEIVVFDLTADGVRELSRFPRPQSRYAGGLVAMGDKLASSWYAVADSKASPDQLTVHWQRMEVLDNGEIEYRDMIVPGIPLSVSPQRSALATLMVNRANLATDDSALCMSTPNARYYDEKLKRCVLVERTLNRSMLLASGPVLVGSDPLSKKAGTMPRLSARNQYLAVQGDSFSFGVFPGAMIPGAADQLFPQPAQGSGATLLYTLGDDASLSLQSLNESSRGYPVLSYLDDRHLLRQSSWGDPLEVYELQGSQAPIKRTYLQRSNQFGCSYPQRDGQELVCAAYERGVFRLTPHTEAR